MHVLWIDEPARTLMGTDEYDVRSRAAGGMLIEWKGRFWKSEFLGK